MSVTNEQAEKLVERLRQVSYEEFVYEGRPSFWSELADECADTISQLLLRKTIKTYLHEGSKKV